MHAYISSARYHFSRFYSFPRPSGADASAHDTPADFIRRHDLTAYLFISRNAASGLFRGVVSFMYSDIFCTRCYSRPRAATQAHRRFLDACPGRRRHSAARGERGRLRARIAASARLACHLGAAMMRQRAPNGRGQRCRCCCSAARGGRRHAPDTEAF